MSGHGNNLPAGTPRGPKNPQGNGGRGGRLGDRRETGQQGSGVGVNAPTHASPARAADTSSTWRGGRGSGRIGDRNVPSLQPDGVGVNASRPMIAATGTTGRSRAGRGGSIMGDRNGSGSRSDDTRPKKPATAPSGLLHMPRPDAVTNPEVFYPPRGKSGWLDQANFPTDVGYDYRFPKCPNCWDWKDHDSRNCPHACYTCGQKHTGRVSFTCLAFKESC